MEKVVKGFITTRKNGTVVVSSSIYCGEGYNQEIFANIKKSLEDFGFYQSVSKNSSYQKFSIDISGILDNEKEKLPKFNINLKEPPCEILLKKKEVDGITSIYLVSYTKDLGKGERVIVLGEMKQREINLESAYVSVFPKDNNRLDYSVVISYDSQDSETEKRLKYLYASGFTQIPGNEGDKYVKVSKSFKASDEEKEIFKQSGVYNNLKLKVEEFRDDIKKITQIVSAEFSVKEETPSPVPEPEVVEKDDDDLPF